MNRTILKQALMRASVMLLTMTAQTAWAETVTLTSETGAVELKNGDVLTGTGGANTHVTIADGATVTLSGVTITSISTYNYWAGITCLGDATIELAKGTTNTLQGGWPTYPALTVAEGKTMTITGQGTLNAYGKKNGSEAMYQSCAIGAGAGQTCGNIVIDGGVINATSYDSSAAIGASYAVSVNVGSTQCGNITISGGMVTAKVINANCSPAIGTGREGQGSGSFGVSTCGDITITEGAVYVEASTNTGNSNFGADVIGRSWFTSDLGMQKYYTQVGTISISSALKSKTTKSEDVSTLTLRHEVTLYGNADNSTTLAQYVYNAGLTDVTLNGYTLYNDGDWNTLTLPFSLTAEQIAASSLAHATIKELNTAASSLNGSELQLNFTPVTSITAGRPSLVKWTVDLLIHNKSEWDTFASKVNNGTESYEGKTVKLANDFDNSGSPITTMVGTNDHPFKGTFDGNGRTLTVNINNSETHTAPFRYVNGATFRNLHIAGKVYGGNNYSGGLIAKVAGGYVTIENCIISAEVCTNASYTGGFIAVIDERYAVFNMSDCLFNGKLTQDYSGGYNGGFVGKIYDDAASRKNIRLKNCLFNPEEITLSDYGSRTIINGTITTSTLSNCYYTRKFGDAQGSAAPDDIVELVDNLGSAWEVVNGKAMPNIGTIGTVGISNLTFTDVTIDMSASTVATSDDGKLMLIGTYSPFTSIDSLLLDAHNAANEAFHAALSAKRDHYAISGWFTDAGKTTPTTSIPFDTDGSATIYTAWSPVTYAITYSGVEGATFETANPDSYTIESAAITLNNPSKEGYTFTGWTGTGLDAASTNVTIATGGYGDRAYTANWTPITYNITYNGVEDATFTTEKNSYTVETETFTLDMPSKMGYLFEGWYDNADFTGDAITSITKSSTTGDKTLYAKWTECKVKLSKTKATIEKGKTLTLKPTLTPSTLEDQSVTWESSDTGIATVSSSGKVKGVKSGIVTITCTSNATGMKATCTVTVSFVKLSKTETILEKGKTLTLTPTVYPSALDDKTVTWTSSDTEVATVSEDGVVTGVKSGTATITCTSNATGLKTTCTVTVGFVKLSKTEAFLDKGKTLKLTPTVYPKTLEDKTVTWKSSKTSIATVSEDGVVSGVKAGTATITCTSNATGLKTTCTVTVGYVKLDQTEAYLQKGKTLKLTPTVYPSALGDKSVTWKSSKTTVAKVSEDGVVSGVKAGTATITCTSNATGLKTTCTVTVGYVKLDQTEAVVEKTKSLKLKATVYPSALGDKSVTWKSSNEKVATVTSKGTVKGVKAGTATITCTSNATGLKTTCKVTVGYVKLDQTEVSVKKGKTVKLTATVYPSKFDQSVTWKSSDKTVATVTSAGKVKGIAAGTATITCTSKATGLSTTCTVTVKASSTSRGLDGDDDEITGIDELNISGPFDVYDLQGRMVRSQATSFDGLSDGIYIVNGKKVLKKG